MRDYMRQGMSVASAYTNDSIVLNVYQKSIKNY